MPNWCSTTYRCIGDKKQIDDFCSILDKLSENKDIRVSNSFGRMWLGCVIDSFGLNWKEYRCRGEITDYYSDGDNCLVIYQETAWCEQEGFRQAIKEHFPNMEVYYYEEEPGLEVFCTNSFDAFPEHYIIDTEEYGQEYFETIEEVCNYLSEILKVKNLKTKEDIEKVIEEYTEKEENKDYYIIFHEIELINE